MKANLIATIGLEQDEISYIKKILPQKECEIIVADVVSDIIASSEIAVIVRADALSQTDIELLYDYYKEIVPFSETVIFLADIDIPIELKKHIMVYKDFDSIRDNLKYILLSAYRKQKKSENFSATLANAILILSTIRKKPYITSAELAEKLELSQRSVQRYIETLRVAGEWIEYDTEHKGWHLQVGKSVLWGDFDEE